MKADFGKLAYRSLSAPSDTSWTNFADVIVKAAERPLTASRADLIAVVSLMSIFTVAIPFSIFGTTPRRP